MPWKAKLTPAHRPRIDAMRARDMEWTEIADALGVSRSCIARFLEKVPAVADASRLVPGDLPAIPAVETREPYPPGHPETWGVIIRGTVLEGVEYAP